MAIDFQQAAQGSKRAVPGDDAAKRRRHIQGVLGGTLTSTTSQSGGGAFALGQVHNEVRHDLLASDARQLAGNVVPRSALAAPGAEPPW
ncbi:DUF935 family protein [Pseudomonas aeruginosa]|uniref:phage portal protein family protein n=1 Tax=Pseudomonas aeruginosa TaxID=287 RepID=UPI0039900339